MVKQANYHLHSIAYIHIFIIFQMFFATQHSRVYITANVMGFVCSTGMSNLIRKDYFEKATGGLGKFSMYIAEDYFMAKLLWDK